MTYNEVNVILYYGIIPFTWLLFLNIPIALLYLLAWVVFSRFPSFSRYCDVIFVKSQNFIKFFGEYTKWSVIICVLIPIAIYIALIVLSIL